MTEGKFAKIHVSYTTTMENDKFNHKRSRRNKK